MKILIVGGTGMIGGHAALRLQRKGHRVVIGGRRPASGGTPLADLDFLQLDYIAGDTPTSALSSFDAVVFAAGQDVRTMPPDADYESYMWRANAEAVPAFFAKLRDAGVATAINIGTFYPQAAPAVAANEPYMRARKAADEGVCALATESFRAFSINPPWVPGVVEGLPSVLWDPYLRYAAGRTDLPEFAPPGGVAFISCASLSDAIEGGLARGEHGVSYLVNDENLSFEAFLGAFFTAFGRTPPKVEEGREHPVIVDLAISWGRGKSLYYDANPREAALLGYRRHDIVRTITEEMVPEYRRREGF
ncbi:MAG: NAD(P)-dependent oxidoreductase [Sphingomonadales bacterium]|nr:MAG: NAD(P)-dependent oxidoreductase [Sphingomonadales bacterium]